MLSLLCCLLLLLWLLLLLLQLCCDLALLRRLHLKIDVAVGRRLGAWLSRLSISARHLLGPRGPLL